MLLKLQHRIELEDLRNAWIKEQKDEGEIDGGSPSDEASGVYEDSLSGSGDSHDYSYSDGWSTRDSKEGDENVEENKESDEEAEQNMEVDENGEEKKKGDKHKRKGSKNSKEKKQGKSKREVRPCPLKGCKSRVIHLPRHLREVHKWTKERARKANSRFGLRESFKKKPVKSESVETKKKDYHRHRSCPIPGCTSVVKRLSMHLQQVHNNIKKGSTEYKKILREARSLKTWRPFGQGETREQEIVVTKQVSDQGFEDDWVEESEAGDNAGVTELQWNENEISIFSSFCQWLTTADGGRKDPKLSKQHASQLNRILSTIDPNKQLKSLFDKKLIRDKFLKEHAEKKYTADTIKAYLLSLRHFCSYITAEKPKSIKVDPALVLQIEEKARLWSSSYKKDSNRRHLQKMNEDLGNLITPEMVSEYERSESARSAISYIGELGGAHSLEVTQPIYTLIRDFVLLQITIANAHRSGVLANMTIGEYKKVKMAEGSYVINVAKHKTDDTHGPARVVLSPTLFSQLKVYVQEVRSQVQESSGNEDNVEATVFLSWSGAKLESGQISTAINAAWRKGGMEGHVSSTLFRKSAVTTIHAQHKEMRGELADLMAHKETTARKFYRLHEKQEACLQAATHLSSVMRSSTTGRKMPERDSKETSDDGTPASPVCDKNTVSESSKERISWKEHDVLAIKELFANEISEQSITMAIVKGRIQGHPTLQQLDPKKVLDRVRSEWRDHGKSKRESQEIADSEQPPNLPAEEETMSQKLNRFFSSDNGSEDILPPSNSSFVSAKLFAQEERKFLLKVCGSMVRVGVISKPVVKEMLGKEEEGKELLKKFTLDQIINRLKYERRLNNRRPKSNLRKLVRH